MSDVLLLTSGGLDSTTLAYWLVERGVAFLPVFLDYGQHCVETEWQTLQEVLPPGTRTPYRLGISDVFGNSRSRLIAEADLWTEQGRRH
ncbi:MAG: 7-cyano-7-deazaguanine synthase [Alphaproteobacteria bacterium]